MKKRPKVLIVDDSQAIVTLVTQQLQIAGYDVIGHTKSIGVAIMILRERPDLILLDVEMPYFNGPEICKLIKQNTSMVSVANTPVLFFSQKNTADLEKLTKECSAQGYIHKSWGTNVLLETVSKYLFANVNTNN